MEGTQRQVYSNLTEMCGCILCLWVLQELWTGYKSLYIIKSTTCWFCIMWYTSVSFRKTVLNQVSVVWTYVSIVGHWLSTSLDELGHWSVWELLPDLLPHSSLLQVFPGRLSLDQGHPANRNVNNELTKCGVPAFYRWRNQKVTTSKCEILQHATRWPFSLSKTIQRLLSLFRIKNVT